MKWATPRAWYIFEKNIASIWVWAVFGSLPMVPFWVIDRRWRINSFSSSLQEAGNKKTTISQVLANTLHRFFKFVHVSSVVKTSVETVKENRGYVSKCNLTLAMSPTCHSNNLTLCQSWLTPFTKMCDLWTLDSPYIKMSDKILQHQFNLEEIIYWGSREGPTTFACKSKIATGRIGIF